MGAAPDRCVRWACVQHVQWAPELPAARICHGHSVENQDTMARGDMQRQSLQEGVAWPVTPCEAGLSQDSETLAISHSVVHKQGRRLSDFRNTGSWHVCTRG